MWVDLISGVIDMVKAEGAEPMRAPERPLAKKRSRFAGQDDKSRMPARLTRGALVGDAGEEADGRWSFAVTLPRSVPPLVVAPRGPDMPFGQTGAPAFDRRFAVLGERPRVELLIESVRRAWTQAEVDWSLADGVLRASAPRFTVRWEMLEILDDGLDLGEALVAASAEPREERWLAAIGDPAWRVGAAAFDALLAQAPSAGGEDGLTKAYERIFASGGGGTTPRLRVYALARAADWEAVAREADGLDSAARSDAFGWLVAEGPTALAAEVAGRLLARRTGLDDARAWWVVDALERGDARLSAVVSPALAERYLLELCERRDRVGEDAGELLVRTGGAQSVRALERREDGVAKELALRIRARLGQGALAVTDGNRDGGLSLDE